MELLLLALAPAAAVIWYIYGRDKYEKEPVRLLVLSFFLGVISIFPAIIGSGLGEAFGFSLSENIFITFAHAFIAVALSEELAKFLFLRYIMFNRKEFNEPFDGIIYAVMIGMGFAAFENILYVSDGGYHTAILRAFTAVPAHAAFGVIMGYFVGLAKFNPKNRQRLLLTGLFWAVVAHGAYDFFLMQQNFELLGLLAFIVLIASVKISRNVIAIHQDSSPFNPKNKVLAEESQPSDTIWEQTELHESNDELNQNQLKHNIDPISDVPQPPDNDNKWDA